MQNWAPPLQRKLDLKTGGCNCMVAAERISGAICMHLYNYLFFTSTCEQALDFYSQCGLGTVVEIKRYGEGGMTVANEAMRGKIMHAKFEGPGIIFFASDNDDAEPMKGAAHILMMHNREQTEQLFKRLGDGGNITTPLGIQSWGDYYGKLTDKFGVQWMLNCIKA